MNCWTCRYFDKEIQYCSKLGHTLENGYAMKYHNELCGEAKPTALCRKSSNCETCENRNRCLRYYEAHKKMTPDTPIKRVIDWLFEWWLLIFSIVIAGVLFYATTLIMLYAGMSLRFNTTVVAQTVVNQIIP